MLRDAEDYYSTVTLELELQYSGRAWKIQTSPALFTALMGGV